jgi:flagellar biosynthesis anti-sigma factor FlgM
MNSKIDSSLRPAPVAAVRPVSKPRDGTPGPSSSERSDSVAVTREAHNLHQLERSALEHSGIDEEKVAAVRKELAEGGYRIDPDAIAGSLLRLEWMLGKSR